MRIKKVQILSQLKHTSFKTTCRAAEIEDNYTVTGDEYGKLYSDLNQVMHIKLGSLMTETELLNYYVTCLNRYGD